MTKQEKAQRALADRVKLLIASAQVLHDEAVNIERELQGLYPTATATKNTGKFQLSDEEKARLRAETYRRRKINIANPK